MDWQDWRALDAASLGKGLAGGAVKINAVITKLLARREALDTQEKEWWQQAAPGAGAPAGEQEAFGQEHLEGQAVLMERRAAILQDDFAVREKIHRLLSARLTEAQAAQAKAGKAPDEARAAIRAVWARLGLYPADAELLPGGVWLLATASHPSVKRAEAEARQAQDMVVSARQDIERNELAAGRVRADRDRAREAPAGLRLRAKEAEKEAGRRAEEQEARSAREAEEATNVARMEHPFDQGGEQ